MESIWNEEEPLLSNEILRVETGKFYGHIITVVLNANNKIIEILKDVEKGDREEFIRFMLTRQRFVCDYGEEDYDEYYRKLPDIEPSNPDVFDWYIAERDKAMEALATIGQERHGMFRVYSTLGTSIGHTSGLSRVDFN